MLEVKKGSGQTAFLEKHIVKWRGTVFKSELNVGVPIAAKRFKSAGGAQILIVGGEVEVFLAYNSLTKKSAL